MAITLLKPPNVGKTVSIDQMMELHPEIEKQIKEALAKINESKPRPTKPKTNPLLNGLLKRL